MEAFFEKDQKLRKERKDLQTMARKGRNAKVLPFGLLDRHH